MPSKQASPREGEGRSVAERMAREIIPKWTNASAANTMEYENALEAQMMEGHGPVEGLMHAIYTGEVDETVDGFLKFQLLKLGGAGSDEEGPNEVDEDTMWGADPVAAFEASRRHEVKPEVPRKEVVTQEALAVKDKNGVAHCFLIRRRAPGAGRPPGGLPSGVWYTPEAAPLPARAGKEARGPLDSGSLPSRRSKPLSQPSAEIPVSWHLARSGTEEIGLFRALTFIASDHIA